MKTHLLAAMYLVITAIFYFSIAGSLVGVYLCLTEPSLGNAVILGACVLVVVIYAVAMKRNPGFRKIVGNFFEDGTPMM